MHTQTLDRWRHGHAYHGDSSRGESRTLWVVALTACMMLVEISAGYLYGSMALLADGWHMGTHVAALSITLFAYRYARAHADNPRFSFGTGKVGSLGGFASAIALAIVAILMGLESVQRLFAPESIRFNEAILVAIIGLAVNLVSAWLLQGGHDHHHHHHHEDHHHHDHNLRAAYLHVLADALTSLLAIAALLGGRTFGWSFLDPLMGIVGGLVILKWSWGLLRTAGQVLLDSAPGVAPLERARRALEAMDDVRVADLHLWALAPGRLACVASVVTHEPRPVEEYHAVLRAATGAHHVTVEVRHCDSGDDEELRAVS